MKNNKSLEKKELVLKVRNLKKIFNSKAGIVKAIDDVSFDVHKGEIVGLIGESGSGKTTVGRCLIRLYENFSGSIVLNNQVISGKKISSKTSKFKNKNIQMIFQDPHASLNPQKNIFSILREPLIINKIMDEEFKLFFDDYEDIKNNFQITFLEDILKIKSESLEYHVAQARSILNDWELKLNDINYDEEFKDENVFANLENLFNLNFNYLLTNQEKESLVVSNNFERNTKAIEFYFENQKKYRDGDILELEKEYKELKKQQIIYKELSSKNQTNIDNEKLLEDLETKLIASYDLMSENKVNTKTIIQSYLSEFKNDYKLYLNNAHSTSDIEKYDVFIKKYYLSKQKFSSLNKIKNKICYLSINDVDAIAQELKQKFYETEERMKLLKPKDASEKEYKIYRNELKVFVNNEGNLDLQKWVIKSQDTFNKLTSELTDIKDEINKVKMIPSSKEAPSISKEEYDLLLIKIKEKEDEIAKDNDDYKIEWNKRIESYNQKIDTLKLELEEIREKIKNLNQVFINNYNNFIVNIKNSSLEQEEKKLKINYFKTLLNNKQDSLQAFKVEFKILENDFDKILILLGIKKSNRAKKIIKELLIKEKIYSSLEEVGLLRQFAWRYPHEFSGGQRQRVVIARALITDPQVIVADEPIASLDVSIQAQVVNLLKELCKEKNISLVFIAHDLSMVEYIADKILIMHLGKLVEFGKTENIYSNPRHPYTINLFKAIPKISNSNEKFESSSFEVEYLKEQMENEELVDYFQVDKKDHYLYGTPDQIQKWTNKKPIISEEYGKKNEYIPFVEKSEELNEIIKEKNSNLEVSSDLKEEDGKKKTNETKIIKEKENETKMIYSIKEQIKANERIAKIFILEKIMNDDEEYDWIFKRFYDSNYRILDSKEEGLKIFDNYEGIAILKVQDNTSIKIEKIIYSKAYTEFISTPNNVIRLEEYHNPEHARHYRRTKIKRHVTQKEDTELSKIDENKYLLEKIVENNETTGWILRKKNDSNYRILDSKEEGIELFNSYKNPELVLEVQSNTTDKFVKTIRYQK